MLGALSQYNIFTAFRVHFYCSIIQGRIRFPVLFPHSEKQEKLCRNGNPFAVKESLPDGEYRIYGADGTFLCLSRLENGTMTSVKNFFGA